MRFALTLLLVVVLSVGGTWVLRSRMVDKAPPVAPRNVSALLPVKDLSEPGREYQRLAITPYDLPGYAFTIQIPSGWRWRMFDVTKEERSEDNKRPMPMAEFGPTDRSDVLLEARYVRVPAHVTLERFLRVYAEQAGFELVARQPGTFLGHEVEDGLLRKQSPDLGPYLTRLTVQRRGELLFLIAGSCVESNYEQYKRALAVAAVSFSPK